MCLRPEQTPQLGKTNIRCSTTYVIREPQMKRMRYRCVPIRMAQTHEDGTVTPANTGEDVQQQEPSFTAGGDAKWYSHFGRQFGGFLLNVLLPFDLAIVLLGVYSKVLKTFTYKKPVRECVWQLYS